MPEVGVEHTSKPIPANSDLFELGTATPNADDRSTFANFLLLATSPMNLQLFAQDFIASINLDTSAWSSRAIYVSIAKLPRNLGGMDTKTFDAVDLYL